MRLRQGDLLLLPAYVFRRTRAPPAGRRCRVVEAEYVGPDRSRLLRYAAVEVAKRTAAALVPARRSHLTTILSENATYFPLLLQALNSRQLPPLSPGLGFVKVAAPLPLFEAVVEHYESHRAAGLVDETVTGVAMHGVPALVAPLVDKTPALLVTGAAESGIRLPAGSHGKP